MTKAAASLFAAVALVTTSLFAAGRVAELTLAMSKTISYRGGIATFSIPKTWREEYEPSGGATFYDDRPDSGTLRLSVLSFESKDTPAQQMALTAFPVGSFELLGDGFPLRHRVQEVTENNELLHIHYWDIAVPIQPKSLRLVLFSHTVLASQETNPAIQAELAFVGQSIRAATFSQFAGVAGNYQNE